MNHIFCHKSENICLLLRFLSFRNLAKDIFVLKSGEYL